MSEPTITYEPKWVRQYDSPTGSEGWVEEWRYLIREPSGHVYDRPFLDGELAEIFRRQEALRIASESAAEHERQVA